ncbi:tetratricopeptide repeat protein 28 isoform X2 [Tachysurus ichikawai]
MNLNTVSFFFFEPFVGRTNVHPRLYKIFHKLAYFRQGVALQYLGRHADALAAFASGLAQDPKSLQLLVGMVEAAMKSPLRARHPNPLAGTRALRENSWRRHSALTEPRLSPETHCFLD